MTFRQRSTSALLLLTTVCFCCIKIGARVPKLSGPGNQKKTREVVGKWEGQVSTGAGEMSMKMDLRADGDHIVGEITNPHGTWTITDCKFSGGKWNIAWRTPEDAAGRMIGSVKGDKLSGNWDFPPNFVGTFDFMRKRDSK